MGALGDILVLVPEISPTDAQVVVLAAVEPASKTQPERLRLQGQVVGPTCAYSSTLTARIPLQSQADSGSTARVRAAKPAEVLRASASLLDPCFWEPTHPFCYELHLELHDEQSCLAKRTIGLGIRHLGVYGNQLRLNGKEVFLAGVRRDAVESEQDLELWHQAGCGAWLARSLGQPYELTDRWGPMILQQLPADPKAALRQVQRLRNHPSLLMWVLPEEIAGPGCEQHIQAIRSRDPSRPIGQFASANQRKTQPGSGAVLFVPVDDPRGISPIPEKPQIAVLGDPADRSACSPSEFASRIAQVREVLGESPGVAGVIL